MNCNHERTEKTKKLWNGYLFIKNGEVDQEVGVFKEVDICSDCMKELPKTPEANLCRIGDPECESCQ